MTGLLHRIPGLRRFARAEEGTSTVEFVIWVPFMLVFLASMVESSAFMMRWMLLDRAVDLAVRDLRINTTTPPTFGELRQSVCDHARLPNCMSSLRVELIYMPAGTWTAFGGSADCVDRAVGIDPAHDAQNVGGAANDIVAVRACALMDPLFPGVGLGAVLPKDTNGELQVVARSAYAQEP